MVLIGFCGPICAGKETLADMVMRQSGKPFQVLRYGSEGDKQTSRRVLAPTHTFHDCSSLDRHVLQDWLGTYVIPSFESVELLEAIAKRPYFLLVFVDAPVSVRYSRYGLSSLEHTLEDFVSLSDKCLFDAERGLVGLFDRAHVRVLNASTSLDKLDSQVAKIRLLDENRFRPSWDAYFMRMANLTALRSNCMKRRVGCVLVREKRVLTTGYNGTPHGLLNCNQGGCRRCNGGAGGGESLTTCLCLHAEENALLEAGKERIGTSTVLYCNTCPCLTCSVKIAQMGIREVVYHASYSMDAESAKILHSGGVVLRQYSAPDDTLTVV